MSCKLVKCRFVLQLINSIFSVSFMMNRTSKVVTYILYQVKLIRLCVTTLLVPFIIKLTKKSLLYTPCLMLSVSLLIV